MDWTEFDSKLDNETMNKLNDLEAGKTPEYKEVPYGKYEVVPEKIELGMTQNGNPKTNIWFRIVAGEFKRSIIFANLIMSGSFGIHKAKQFIKSLEPETSVKFESFTQWDIYLKGVAEELCGQVSYVLDYESETDKKTGKIHPTYTIEDGPFETPEDYEAPSE